MQCDSNLKKLLQGNVTYTEQGVGTDDYLTSEEYSQCVAKVICKEIQTSVVKKIEACTEPVLITSETSMNTDPVTFVEETQTDSR